MLQTLYLYTDTKVSQFIFSKKKQLSPDVWHISLQLDPLQIVDAVLKKKSRYKLKENLKNTIFKSKIGKETKLHSFLFQNVPKHIVPLIFPLENSFTFLKSEKTLTPVKITKFCSNDTLRSDMKLAQLSMEIAKNLVIQAMKKYEKINISNRDWLEKRNILFVQGKCLFHDFDLSV